MFSSKIFLSKDFWSSFQSKLLTAVFFQCKFLPAVGPNTFYIIGFFQHGIGSLGRSTRHHTFILYSNVPVSSWCYFISWSIKVRGTTTFDVFLDISKVQFDKTLIMLGRKNCGFNMFAGVAWLHIPNLSERIAPCKSRKISRSDGRHQTTMQKHGVNQSYRH